MAHELRTLFSQEMGIAAKEIHDNGSVLQLKVGSSLIVNAMTDVRPGFIVWEWR